MSELKFFEQIARIDQLLETADAQGYEETFLEISKFFNNIHICRYFFEHISEKGWFSAVVGSDYFESLLSQLKKAQTDFVPSYEWCFINYFMKYLERVAYEIPEETFVFLEKISFLHDERLREQIVSVVLKLPKDIGASLAANEIDWLKSRTSVVGLYSDYAGKLMLHIQDRDENISLELFQSLLEVKEIATNTKSSALAPKSEISTKFSDWDFQTLLEKYITKYILNSSNYEPAFRCLCDVFDQALELERTDSQEDYSWIWRNTLIDNEQTKYSTGIKEHLLVCIRDTSLELIRQEESGFDAIQKVFSGYKWTIFKRLSIFLSVNFPKLDISLTERLIKETELYEDNRTKNEYSLLLKSAFGFVKEDCRQVIFDWINTGFDRNEFEAHITELTGTPPSEREVSSASKNWQKNRLYLIKDYLDAEWQDKYNALVNDEGEPEHPEYSSYTTSWVGPTSPKTTSELSSLTVEELVQFLKEWKPSGGSFDATPEGLGRSLSSVLDTNINNYKHSIESFIGLPPTYIRAIFQALRDNAEQLDHESWRQIFSLIEYTHQFEGEVQTHNEIDEFDEDKNWVTCQKTIASLLNSGLKKGAGQIPMQLRSRVWSALEVLTNNADPTPPDEERLGGDNMSPTDLAINTVRGEAMHALIEYGLWVARSKDIKQLSFQDIPEMREVLDKHLIPEYEPSQAIRSVYGQYFPWLVLLDSDWALDAKSRVFSDDENGLGNAAWEAYLLFCQPYDDTFKIISDVYMRQTKQLAEVENNGDRDRAIENFAAHLMTFYWRSKIELNDDLIQSFYQNAPSHLRNYAVEFIGRSLKNTSGVLDENIEQRLINFYEWRQAEAKRAGDYEELQGFCWWIYAEILDKKWALEKFHDLLKSEKQIDDLDFAIRNLDQYLETDPVKVLECLNILVDKIDNKRPYFTWKEEAKKILEKTITERALEEQSANLIHKFGSKGYMDFRQLLTY